MRVDATKIFGVGLNKTGTKSLSRAVEILGFSSIHYAGHNTNDAIERAILEGKPIFSYCPRAIRKSDAYFDIPATERHFDVADRQYPGSRFILHTRDLDAWLDSRERHVLRNQRFVAEGRYKGNWLDVDRAAWTEEWHTHHQRVRRYFADRPEDLLEVDVVRGDGWDKLAPFLGRPIPDEPFPFVTSTGAHRPTATPTVLRRAASHLKSGGRRWVQ